MDAGDIINLLLVAAFVVVAPLLGMIGKKKSTSSATSAQPHPEDDIHGFETSNENGVKSGDFYEQLQHEKKHTEQHDNNNYIESKNEGKNNAYEQLNVQNLPENEQKTKNKKNGTSESKDIKQGLNQHLKEKSAAKSKTSATQIVKDFDIKKAVIYSEILNTKYF
ncbi:MAG: hypothetical protein ACQES1_04995 [Bacteroidota bacterium]